MAPRAGEVVIEVNEVEADARISRAGDGHLPPAEPERSQGRLEQWAADRIKDGIDSSSRRQFQDPLTKVFGLGIDYRLGARKRIGFRIRPDDARLFPIRNLCGCLAYRSRGAHN